MSRRLVTLLALAAVPAAPLVTGGAPPVPISHTVDLGASSHAWVAPLAAPSAMPRAQEAPAGPYLAKQLMVRAPDAATLVALAHTLHARVEAPPGRSGFGVITVEDVQAATAELAALGATVAPHAVTVGTWSGWGSSWSDDDDDDDDDDGWSNDDDDDDDDDDDEQAPEPTETTPATAESSQTSPALTLPEPWQLSAARIDQEGDVSAYRVAVLDTGVAYETTGAFVQAPGLSGVTFVAPADFIEHDGHPNDDHQHGTHIASIIASESAYPGVAPGVSLIPVKVLDQNNRGTEWALVEGIHHAIDNGANVINMSLSFPLGYVPSQPLSEALVRAHDNDVVLVAAAGNDGAKELSWPAASRLVVSVGASVSSPDTAWWSHTSYSNRSPGLDILAPGGSLDRDENGDGFPDGIVAETIHPADPSVVSWWMYEGTSQAAAVVSGAVVHALADGIAPRDVAATLQQSQGGYDSFKALLDGAGAGHLDLQQALTVPSVHHEVYVGLLPFLTEGWFGPEPSARVVVRDELGEPVVDATVMGTIYAADKPTWTLCNTDDDGVCTLRALGSSSSDAWAIRADMVVHDGVAVSPSRLLFATDAGEVMLKAIENAVEESDEGEATSIAVHWDAGDDPELGATLLESWAVVDTGTGLLSSPMGLLFRPSHLATFAEPGTLMADPDGTGLLSSPLGFRVTLQTLLFDGSGLLSSPLGFTRLRLVGLSGNGLLSSPLGFHATHLYALRSSLGGTGLLSSPLGFVGQPIFMDRGTSAVSLLGTAYADAIDAGGTVTTQSGYAPSSWLVASGLVDVGLALAPTTASPASTAEAEEVD